MSIFRSHNRKVITGNKIRERRDHGGFGYSWTGYHDAQPGWGLGRLEAPGMGQ
jgi:hypothetical protein